ncbi:helix-turn-helix transcriptional regulator [Thiotrichales bacterium HSG1]|nr:helix-turn-helix transcriptional regulator [Thiotrichales bacterium HSG1]
MLKTPREVIGDLLRVERKRRRYSQVDVADAINTDRSVISKIENGVYNGTLKVYERYITHMGFHLCIEKSVPQRPQFEDLKDLFPDDE